jgi:predicted kinase
MSATLVIIRGLPGSGKTTLAKRMIGAGFLHFEADKFFERDGQYRFDATRLSEAHDDCLSRTMQAIDDGYDVVVSNTFTRMLEMEPYINGAKERGVTVAIMETTGAFENVHGVPRDAIDRMRARWEAIKITGEQP